MDNTQTLKFHHLTSCECMMLKRVLKLLAGNDFQRRIPSIAKRLNAPRSPPEPHPMMRPARGFCAVGQALKLRGRLIPPKKLLGRIASVYARKILLDQTDDRSGRCAVSRQGRGGVGGMGV